MASEQIAWGKIVEGCGLGSLVKARSRVIPARFSMGDVLGESRTQ